MTDKEIEGYRKRLNELTAQCSDKKHEKQIREALRELAREVGASTCVLWVHLTSSSIRSSDADTSELIRNIHQALQTASMVNMCSAATNGYKMATEESKAARVQFWIATAISFICAVAAWIAAFRN